MLTTRLQILAVLTAFLSSSASPAPTQGALTVARTGRLHVHPGTELALHCGDGTHTGTVQYWHTPFGQLRNHGNRGHLAPAVSMQSDGGLFAANAGVRHGGLYYCLLEAEGGTTLWPYRVTVGTNSGPDLRATRHRSAADAGVRRDRRPPRHRRDRGSKEGANEDQAGVTDGAFAGAVVASVAVTFVVGFGAGALSSTRVLRCLGLVSSSIQSLRRGPATGRGGGVPMTTAGRDYDDTDSHWGETTMDTTCSSCTSPPPPPKPQRSFRDKRGEHPGPAAGMEEEEEEKVQKRRGGQEERVVEGRMKEGKEGELEEEYVEERVEDRRTEERRESREEEQIREVKQVDKGGEMEERRGSRPGESREGETDEKEAEQWIEERTERREEQEQEVDERILARRESREGEAGVTGEESRVSGDRLPMATITEGSSQAGGGGMGEPGRTSVGMAEGEEEVVVVEQTETTCAREQCRDKGGAEEQGEVSSEDDSDSSSDTQDEGEQAKREEGREQVTKNDKGGAEEGGTPQSGVARGRRSRVIRLYQYDDEGNRYSHLPSPAPGELSPTPRLKQRSLSLTRLSAIMAAATAGPLTSPGGGAGAEERCPSPPFSPAPVFKMDL